MDPYDFSSYTRNHVYEATQSKSPGSDGASPAERSERSSSSRFSFGPLKIGSPWNKDGEKPKRRGPKPDSKPALTRRQELNRQAQRTHRERKERYIKTIEEEVARLREAFTVITREKTAMAEENRRLRAILDAHGIPYDFQDVSPNVGQRPRHDEYQQAPEMERFGSTYDGIGIDFVLALEKPCMDHIQILTANSMTSPASDFHGHALMASCPSESNTSRHAEVPRGSKTFDVGPSELAILFNLSNRLELDGELTPIAVWAHVTRHERFADLEMADFKALEKTLLDKVKCHGFGAVVEEYEVVDALSEIIAKRFGGGGDVGGGS
ncbi:unnamed protein product [Tuber melanosporum]|uniref:(Perigord truffle) hypothetical protein n=1 Tax=Tuber melanosporum (strain Mel28) TaxID=656061 RepID=D5G5X5_TUBMM|nr:uncharacterized protein GSTUM_00001612001 [Tuber melanosporum]CAZ79918.1 unnamed protein product [Tuber melanosporum]